MSFMASFAEQGVVKWPEWAIFHQLGYFWRHIMIFWKEEVAQNYGNFLGYFMLRQIYYIFT
jgi:hypothetical protein